MKVPAGWEKVMRELTNIELQAVSGGVMAPPPRPRRPILALIVAIIAAILRRGNPPTKAVA
jgi:hypothetical protein